MIIVTNEQIDYSVDLNGDRLRIDFGVDLTGDFQAPVATAADFFVSAHHQDQTDHLEFTINNSVSVHHSQSFNVIAIDLMAPEFSGRKTNVISYREMMHERVAGFFSDRQPSAKSRSEVLKPAEESAHPLHLGSLQAAEIDADVSATIDPSITFYKLFSRPVGNAVDGGKLTVSFVEQETALLSAHAVATQAETTSASAAVFKFYIEHQLYAELYAFAHSHPSREESVFIRLVEGFALYKMGRFGDVIDHLAHHSTQSTGAAKIVVAMSKVQIGSYRAAGAALFDGALDAEFPFKNEFYLLKAEAALAVDEPAIARTAIAAVVEEALPREGVQQLMLMRALTSSKTGREKEAADVMRSLARNSISPQNVEAGVHLAYSRGIQDPSFASEAIEQIDDLLLAWRGGRTERVALHRIALLSDLIGDLPRRMDAWNRIHEQYPFADIAQEAEIKLRECLFELVAENNVAPMEAARLFYQTIDFAPPGQAGDNLILKVVEDLVALDLLDEAAELLAHQTFERSRGSRRSEMAARLAEVYLRNEKPHEALRAIRSTRRARLPEELNNERALLEARASTLTGEMETALAILDNTTGNAGDALRGEIHWAAGAWNAAGAAYENSVTIEPDMQQFDRAASMRLLRAAAAYLNAGDLEKLTRLRSEVSGKLFSSQANELFRKITSGEFGETPTDFLAEYSVIFSSEA